MSRPVPLARGQSGDGNVSGSAAACPGRPFGCTPPRSFRITRASHGLVPLARGPVRCGIGSFSLQRERLRCTPAQAVLVRMSHQPVRSARPQPFPAPKRLFLTARGRGRPVHCARPPCHLLWCERHEPVRSAARSPFRCGGPVPLQRNRVGDR